ncbi:hypothetical protein AVEN_209200-1 [Araneus ventricosus]|uniref:Mutator-like transposase domain-containing protein n=1 Tax=Araneus ventricosus TaxID=182803 RepID=A0A4Y2WV12_ARAVE|nr:hypothetical protein AVEN_209200-1 [Araneus ventricosus]
MPRSTRIFKKRSGKIYKKSEKAVTQVENLSPNGQQTCTKERKIPNIDDSFSAENTGKGVLNSIIDENILARVFKNFVNCKNCNSGLEQQMLKSTSGLAVSFIWNCFQCEYTHEFSSSEFHEGTQIATNDTRYVYALRSIGKGAEAGRMFCAVMNLPQPPPRFQNYNNVTVMESRIPAMQVLWLRREFYKVKHGVTSATLMARITLATILATWRQIWRPWR